MAKRERAIVPAGPHAEALATCVETDQRQHHESQRVATTYTHAEAIEEGRRFLAGRPYVRTEEAQRYLKLAHRVWAKADPKDFAALQANMAQRAGKVAKPVAMGE